MEAEGKLRIYDNISKNEYYAHLNDTRVLFNCALQDWVSNTVSEADTLGCNVLYPAYRSFPETFANDPNRLYVPWSIDDAYHKLQNLLREPHHNMGLISDWNNGTVDRVVDIILGQGEQWDAHLERLKRLQRSNECECGNADLERDAGEYGVDGGERSDIERAEWFCAGDEHDADSGWVGEPV